MTPSTVLCQQCRTMGFCPGSLFISKWRENKLLKVWKRSEFRNVSLLQLKEWNHQEKETGESLNFLIYWHLVCVFHCCYSYISGFYNSIPHIRVSLMVARWFWGDRRGRGGEKTNLNNNKPYITDEFHFVFLFNINSVKLAKIEQNDEKH